MKRTLLLTFLLLATITARAEDAALQVKQSDVDKVQLEMKPDTKTEVRVYLSSKKLAEFVTLTEGNLKKQVPIYVEGKLAAAPIIGKEFLEKIRYISLRYNDFDSAAQAAHAFFPSK